MTRKLQSPSPALVVACIALLVALGPAVQAANTVFSTDIVDGQVKAVDLATNAVTNTKLAANSVGPGKVLDNSLSGADVLNNSLTTADIAGADVNGGSITVPTGYVPNGRCRQLDASVNGATAGEAVIFSIKAPLQDGIVIYGQRVPSNGHVTFNVCNFSGTTQAQINNLPVRIITFG